MQQIIEQTKNVIEEFLNITKLGEGDLLAVGCSSSEICGEKIGTASSVDAAQVVFETIYEACKDRGVYLAAQCCEHLNRALVVEKEIAKQKNFTPVNVVPQPKAGGSFATAAYRTMSEPVMVENVQADGGIDIGDTLIGMHLKAVAVPLRLETKYIGEARVTSARTRAKFIGGCRAVYDEELL